MQSFNDGKSQWNKSIKVSSFCWAHATTHSDFLSFREFSFQTRNRQLTLLRLWNKIIFYLYSPLLNITLLPWRKWILSLSRLKLRRIFFARRLRCWRILIEEMTNDVKARRRNTWLIDWRFYAIVSLVNKLLDIELQWILRTQIVSFQNDWP